MRKYELWINNVFIHSIQCNKDTNPLAMFSLTDEVYAAMEPFHDTTHTGYNAYVDGNFWEVRRKND